MAAITDVVAISIPNASFKALYDKLPAFARHLLAEMAPQFCSAHCDCALSMESVDKRLAHMVLRLDSQFQGGEIPFTRTELAQMVGNTTVRNLHPHPEQLGQEGLDARGARPFQAD